MPPIPENLVAYLAAAGPVDEDPARRDLARQPATLAIEADDVAVLRQQDFRAPRHPAGDAGVPGKLAVLTVYRHEVARPDQGKHQFQLFLAAMSGNMDVFEAFVDQFGASFGDMVHHPADGLLVARNFTRREHDDVLRLQPDVAVVVDGNPGERRLGLPLGARAEAHDVLSREVADVAVLDLHAGRDPEIAQPLRDLGVVDHPAADERHSAVELRREVDDDLHPIDARREGGDDDLAVCVGEDLLEGIGYVDFGSRETAAVDVGAVGQQCQNTRRAELSQPVHVDALAVDRGLVDLEVAGVDDDAVRRLDGQRDAVRDAVGDPKKLDGERSRP